MKVSFKLVQIPLNPKLTEFEVKDLRKEFANYLFKSTSDIEGHRLSEKIYDSGDFIDLNKEEIAYLQDYIARSGIANAVRIGLENALTKKS
jgi:hypothetical protein